MGTKLFKDFILKRLYELPEAIGVGIGLSLLSIGGPYFILEILAPNYKINFNSLFPRWATICVLLTLIYYWYKAWNIKK